MTVLVTGAAGFLGSHVTELLLERGDRLRVMIRPGESVVAPTGADVEVHSADIADRSALESALDGVDLVLHCAARTGPWGREAEYERTNVRGLETLVRTALAAGVRRLVHRQFGHRSRYACARPGRRGRPVSKGAESIHSLKVAGERLLEHMIRNEQAPVSIVRPGWIYGPRDTASFGRLAQLIDDGKMVMAGTGRNHLPLIYVRDVARGMLLAGDAERAAGRSYLLVNDEPVTQRDFLGAIATELGVPVPRRRIPYRARVDARCPSEAGGRFGQTGAAARHSLRIQLLRRGAGSPSRGHDRSLDSRH
jgi:nucleoside-diphosphate-sugar epimerase